MTEHANVLKAEAWFKEFPFLSNMTNKRWIAIVGASVQRWHNGFLGLEVRNSFNSVVRDIYFLDKHGEILAQVGGSSARRFWTLFALFAIPISAPLVGASILGGGWAVVLVVFAAIVALGVLPVVAMAFGDHDGSVKEELDKMEGKIEHVYYGLSIPCPGSSEGRVVIYKPPHGFPSVADWFAHWKAKAAEEVHSQVSSA